MSSPTSGRLLTITLYSMRPGAPSSTDPRRRRYASEVFLPGWRVVKNLDRSTLARNIESANWTSFCMGREIRTTVFGIDEKKMVVRATKEILARLKSEKFNSLEITRVSSVTSERFLGVRSLTVSAQSRLIQKAVV